MTGELFCPGEAVLKAGVIFVVGRLRRTHRMEQARAVTPLAHAEEGDVVFVRIEFPLAGSTFDGVIPGGWGRLVRPFLFVAWHVGGSLEGRSQSEILVSKCGYALILRRQNQPDDVRFPFGHTRQEKSYWSAQLSTIFLQKLFGYQVEALSHFRDKNQFTNSTRPSNKS
ncbi:MAG: hypothetical protein HYX68_05860 [Planctomycetes bacterium]|nr:hypothetical protein [Planctomycetota bacterium]